MSEVREIPLVSIIIPCFKQAHWLPDAIESALAQTYKNVEVIVVNDGSPDNTSEVARKYPVVLIEQENKGLSVARNAGIKASGGDYILTLDADDKITPDFIDKTIGVDDIVGTAQQEFGESNTLWNTQLEHPTFSDFIVGNQINCCSLQKADVYKNIGGYDEMMKDGYEDWDYWLRAAKAGYTFTVIREPLFFYRKRGWSMVDNATSKHKDLHLYIVKKHT